VRARRGALERLTVMCTQGHYQEDGAFVDVAAHHDLDAGALGVILGAPALFHYSLYSLLPFVNKFTSFFTRVFRHAQARPRSAYARCASST
jgi:hypothetical protein